MIEEDNSNGGRGNLKSLLADCTIFAENASNEEEFKRQTDLLFDKYSLDGSSKEVSMMKSFVKEMCAMTFHSKKSVNEGPGVNSPDMSSVGRSSPHQGDPVRVTPTAAKSSSKVSPQQHMMTSNSTDLYGYGALSDPSQIIIHHHPAGHASRPSQLGRGQLPSAMELGLLEHPVALDSCSDDDGDDLSFDGCADADDDNSGRYRSGSDIPSSEDSHSRHSETSIKDLSDGEGIGIDLNTTAITTRMKSRMSLTSPPAILQPTDAGDRMHLQDSRSSSVSPVTGTGQSSSSQGSANSGSSSDHGNDDLDSSEPDERIMFKSASDYITFSTPEQNPPSPSLQSTEVGDVHDEDPCYNLKKLSEGLEEESEEAYLQSFKKSSPPHVAPSPPSQDRFSVLLTHPQGTALDNLMQRKALEPSRSKDQVPNGDETFDNEEYFGEDGLSDLHDINVNVTCSPPNPNTKSRETISSLTEQLGSVMRKTVASFPTSPEDDLFSKELLNKVGHDVVVSLELKDLNADDAWNAMRPVLNMFVDASVKDEDNIRLLVDTICLSLQHPKSRSLYDDSISSCPDSEPMDSSSQSTSTTGFSSDSDDYIFDSVKCFKDEPLVQTPDIVSDDDSDELLNQQLKNNSIKTDVMYEVDVDLPPRGACVSPPMATPTNANDCSLESRDQHSSSSSDSSVTVVMMVDPSSFQGERDNKPIAISEQQHDGNRALYTGEYRYDDGALAIEGYHSQDSDATPDRGVGVGMLSYQDSDDHHVQDFETNSTRTGYVAPWEEETGEDILYSPARNTAKSSKSPTSVSPLDHQFRTTVGGIGRPSLKSLMIYSPNRKKSGEDGGEGEWYRWDQEGSGEAQGDEEDASWGTGMWVDGPQQREVSSATQDWTSDQVEVALDCVIGLDDLPDVPDAASSIIQSCKSPQLSPPKITLPSSLQGSPERSVLLEHIDPNGISRRPAQFMLDRNGWRDRNEKDEVAGDIPDDDDGCIENVEELRHLSPRSAAYQVAHSYSSVQEPINGLFEGQLDGNSVGSTSTASTVENSYPVVGSTGHHRRLKSEESNSNQMFQSFCDEDLDLDDEEYDDNVLFMGADESRAAAYAIDAPAFTWDEMLKSSGSKKKMNHSMCSTASSVSSYEDALAYALHKDKKDLMPSSSVDSDRNLSDTASTAVNVSVDEKGRVFVKNNPCSDSNRHGGGEEERDSADFIPSKRKACSGMNQTNFLAGLHERASAHTGELSSHTDPQSPHTWPALKTAHINNDDDVLQSLYQQNRELELPVMQNEDDISPLSHPISFADDFDGYGNLPKPFVTGTFTRNPDLNHQIKTALNDVTDMYRGQQVSADWDASVENTQVNDDGFGDCMSQSSSSKSSCSRSNSSQSSSSSGSWNSGPSHGVSISSVSMNTNTTGNLTRTTVGTGLYSNTESGSVPYGVSNQHHTGDNTQLNSMALLNDEFAGSAMLDDFDDSDTSDESSRSPSLQSNETSEGGDASDASQSPHTLSAHPSQLSIGTDLAVFNGVSNVTQYAAQREAARQPLLDADGADDDEDDDVNTNVAVVTKLHDNKGDCGSGVLTPNEEEEDTPCDYTIETSATTLGDYEYDGYLMEGGGLGDNMYPQDPRSYAAGGGESDGLQVPWDRELEEHGHAGRAQSISSTLSTLTDGVLPNNRQFVFSRPHDVPYPEEKTDPDPYSTVSSITSVGGPRHTVSWEQLDDDEHTGYGRRPPQHHRHQQSNEQRRTNRTISSGEVGVKGRRRRASGAATTFSHQSVPMGTSRAVPASSGTNSHTHSPHGRSRLATGASNSSPAGGKNVSRKDRNNVSAARRNTSNVSSSHSTPNRGESRDLSDKHTHAAWVSTLSSSPKNVAADSKGKTLLSNQQVPADQIEFYQNMLYVMNAVGTNADIYNAIFGSGEMGRGREQLDRHADASASGDIPVDGTHPLLNERILRELLPYPLYVEPSVGTGTGGLVGSGSGNQSVEQLVASTPEQLVVGNSINGPASRKTRTKRSTGTAVGISAQGPIRGSTGHAAGQSTRRVRTSAKACSKASAQPVDGGVTGRLLRKPAVPPAKVRPASRNSATVAGQRTRPCTTSITPSSLTGSLKRTGNGNGGDSNNVGNVRGLGTSRTQLCPDDVFPTPFPTFETENDGDYVIVNNDMSDQHGWPDSSLQYRGVDDQESLHLDGSNDESSEEDAAQWLGGDDRQSTDIRPNIGVAPPLHLHARVDRPKSAGKMSYLASHPKHAYHEFKDMQEGSVLDQENATRNGRNRVTSSDDSVFRDLDSHAEPDYVYPMWYDEHGEPFLAIAKDNQEDQQDWEAEVKVRPPMQLSVSVSIPSAGSNHHTSGSSSLQSTALLSSIMATRRSGSGSTASSPKRVQQTPQLSNTSSPRSSGRKTGEKRRKSVGDIYSELQGANTVAPHSKMSRSSYESYVRVKGPQVGSSSIVKSTSTRKVDGNGRRASGMSRSNRSQSADPDAKRGTRLVASALAKSPSRSPLSARSSALQTTVIRRSNAAQTHGYHSVSKGKGASNAQFAAPTMSSLHKSAISVKVTPYPFNNIRLRTSSLGDPRLKPAKPSINSGNRR